VTAANCSSVNNKALVVGVEVAVAVVVAAEAAVVVVPIKVDDEAVPNPAATAIAAFLSHPKTSRRLPVGGVGVVANKRTVVVASSRRVREYCGCCCNDEDVVVAACGAKHRVVGSCSNNASATMIHSSCCNSMADLVIPVKNTIMAAAAAHNVREREREERSTHCGRRCPAATTTLARLRVMMSWRKKTDGMTQLVSPKFLLSKILVHQCQLKSTLTAKNPSVTHLLHCELAPIMAWHAFRNSFHIQSCTTVVLYLVLLGTIVKHSLRNA
jgi:hypothetical protein